MFDGHGFFGGGLMWLWWIVLIVVVVWVVRAVLSDDRSDRRKDRSAREILEARFAAGEIDQEEFERKRKALDQ